MTVLSPRSVIQSIVSPLITSLALKTNLLVILAGLPVFISKYIMKGSCSRLLSPDRTLKESMSIPFLLHVKPVTLTAIQVNSTLVLGQMVFPDVTSTGLVNVSETDD